MIKVLFVCMGNICRSPTAEGVFTHLVAERGFKDRIIVDSAGTHGWHEGNPPDSRSIAAAVDRGIDISHQRSRRLVPADFHEYDYIVAMDRANLDHMEGICPPGAETKLSLLLEFAKQLEEEEVPDPYYGIGDGFSYVFDLVETAAGDLLEVIHARHLAVAASPA